MNTTSSLAAIALVGTIAAVITGLSMSKLDSFEQKEPEIKSSTMYKVDGQIIAELVNTGQAINTSKMQLIYDSNGITYQHATLPEDLKHEKNCLPNGTWNTDQRVECRTGIEFPNAGNEIELTLLYNNETHWNSACRPSTSSSVGC